MTPKKPPTRPALTERFMIRCSEHDLARWRLRASSLGLTVGQWLRMVAMKADRSEQ